MRCKTASAAETFFGGTLTCGPLKGRGGLRKGERKCRASDRERWSGSWSGARGRNASSGTTSTATSTGGTSCAAAETGTPRGRRSETTRTATARSVRPTRTRPTAPRGSRWRSSASWSTRAEAYVESFAGTAPVVESYTERTTSPVSDALSADMRRRGMKFVGSTTIYAFLQAAGFIDAHGPECQIGARESSASADS